MAPYIKAHQIPPYDYHSQSPTPASSMPSSISKHHVPRGEMHPILSAPPSSFSVMRYVWGDFYINQSSAKRVGITLLSVLLIIIFIFSFILLSCALVAGIKTLRRKYKTSDYHKNHRVGEKWVMYHGMRGHWRRGYFEPVQEYGRRTEKGSAMMKDLERGEQDQGSEEKRGKGKWWKRKGTGTQVNVTEVGGEGILGREITEAELVDEGALENVSFWKGIFGTKKKVAKDIALDAAIPDMSVGAGDDEGGGARDDTRGRRMGTMERGGALEIDDLERGDPVKKGKGKWWKRKGKGTQAQVKVTEVTGGGILGREITEAEITDEEGLTKIPWYKRVFGEKKKTDNRRDTGAPEIFIDGAERGDAGEGSRGRRMGVRERGDRIARDGAVIRGRSLVRSLGSSSGRGQADGADSERTRSSTSGELAVPPAEADTESDASAEVQMPPLVRVNSRGIPMAMEGFRHPDFITLSDVENMGRAIRDRVNSRSVPVVRERSTRDPNFITPSDVESARRASRTNLDPIMENDSSTRSSSQSSVFSAPVGAGQGWTKLDGRGASRRSR